MQRLEPTAKKKSEPNVGFWKMSGGRTRIVIHEDVMNDAGFSVGDLVDVHILHESALVITRTTDAERSFTIQSNPNPNDFNHGTIIVKMGEKRPLKTFKVEVTEGMVSVPLVYRKRKR